MRSSSGSLDVNFGRIADGYSQYRGGFPPALFDRIESHYGATLAGQYVLDMGCGTGALANELAARHGYVTAIDLSEGMIAQASGCAEREGVRVTYRCGSAEATGLRQESFDLVTAGRCWHWFDRPKVAAEVRRVLRKRGMLAICHFDRVRGADGDLVAATQALVERHNPAWAQAPPQRFGLGVGIYAQWLGDMRDAGFGDLETFSFDVTVPYTHEAWRGRVRSSGGVGGSLGPEAVARLDEELGELLSARFSHEPVAVTQRVFCAMGRRPG